MMDAEERALFETSIRAASSGADGAALDRALDELGWHEALVADPRVAVASLFEALGATNSTASVLESIVGSALDATAGPSVAAILPSLGRWQAPGRLTGGDLFVGGVGTALVAGSATAWVVADSGENTVVVEVATSDLSLRSVAGVDPRLGLVEVTGERVPFSAQLRLEPGDWPHAVAIAQLALGHQLVGASRTMLELARTHSLERIQFGQAIASFQAVRHRLAETLVAIEASDAVLRSAWDEGSPASAAAAKALAGRSARTAVRHCQQVLAGIGFTTEHDFHHYVRRILVLDQLFGTSLGLTRAFGRELLATRRLPALPLL